MSDRGMYKVHDPATPKLVVGRFTILTQKPGWLWIQNGEDEGAEFDAYEFETLLVVHPAHLDLDVALGFLTEEMVAQFYRERL